MPFPRLPALILAVALMLATPATAEPIPGADSPDFIAARGSWLAGDDLSALQALAGLARNQNTAAQMLLSRIAMATHTHVHVTADMPRRDRIALLRQEGGLSGRDWMQAAAENSHLAQAYWSSRSPIRDDLVIAENVRLYLASDDRRSAFEAISESLNSGVYDRLNNASIMLRAFSETLGPAGDWLLASALSSAALRGPVRVPPEAATRDSFARYLNTLRTPEAAFAAVGSLTIRSYLNNPSDPPLDVEWSGVTDYDETVLHLIAAVPSTQPIAHFCAQACPDSFDTCLVSAAEAFSQIGAFPFPFDSPLPALVSTNAYQASPRFFTDVSVRLNDNVFADNIGFGWQGCTAR